MATGGTEFSYVPRTAVSPNTKKHFDSKLLDKVIGTINKRSSIAAEFQKNMLQVALKNQKIHMTKRRTVTKQEEVAEGISAHLGFTRKDEALRLMQEESEKMVKNLIDEINRNKKQDTITTYSESSSSQEEDMEEESTLESETEMEEPPTEKKPPIRKPKTDKILRPNIVNITAPPVQQKTKTALPFVKVNKFNIRQNKMTTKDAKSKLISLKPKVQDMRTAIPKTREKQRRFEQEEERLANLTEVALEVVRLSKKGSTIEDKKREGIKHEIKHTEKIPMVASIKEQLGKVLETPTDTRGSVIIVKDMEKDVKKFDIIDKLKAKKGERKTVLMEGDYRLKETENKMGKGQRDMKDKAMQSGDKQTEEKYKKHSRKKSALKPVDSGGYTGDGEKSDEESSDSDESYEGGITKENFKTFEKNKFRFTIKKSGLSSTKTQWSLKLLKFLKNDKPTESTDKRLASIPSKKKRRLSEHHSKVIDELTKKRMVKKVSVLLETIIKTPESSDAEKKKVSKQKTSHHNNIWESFMKVASDDEEELLLEREKRQSTIAQIDNKLKNASKKTIFYTKDLDKIGSETKEDGRKYLSYLTRKSNSLNGEREQFIDRVKESKLKILEEQAQKSKVPEHVLLEEKRRQNLIQASIQRCEPQRIDSRKPAPIKETTMEEILQMRGFRGRVKKNRGNEIWINRPEFMDYFKPMERKESRFEMAKRIYNRGVPEGKGVSVLKKPLPTEDTDSLSGEISDPRVNISRLQQS